MGMSTLTTALGGTIQYATTGQMPQQLTDYIFPRIDKNDPEQRISVPSYWKDIIHLLHKPGRIHKQFTCRDMGKSRTINAE